MQTMKRNELAEIISNCANKAGCKPEDEKRLVATVQTTEYIAFGAFGVVISTGGDCGTKKIINCGCPTVEAGYFSSHYGWLPNTPQSVIDFVNYFDTQMTAIVGFHYMVIYLEN